MANRNLIFSSEFLLQQAVVGLLGRMPGISDVEVLQGPLELGKDIVFNFQGAFGEAFRCACVVKNTKITGRADRPSGAMTVFNQITQALDNKYLSSSTGEHLVIKRVYVVTPEPIPQTTMTSIAGSLDRFRGLIEFVDGPRLFRLFRKHWPDYLSEEHSALEGHLKRIEQAAQDQTDLQEVISIYKLDKSVLAEQKIYVERSLERSLRSVNFIGFETSFPDPDAFSRPLDCKDIKEFVAKLEYLGKQLLHLNRWGFAFDSASSGAQESLTMLTQLIKESWLSIARDTLGSQITIYNAPARKETEFAVMDGSGGSARGESGKATSKKFENEFLLDWRVAEQIEERTIRARIKLQEVCFPLRVACRVSQALPRKNTVQAGRLHYPDGLLTSRLDDLLRASSERPFLEPSDGAFISLGEDELLSKGVSFLIVGAAGFGKTSFCKWNMLMDAEKFRSGQHSTFPVYVPLHSLSRKPIKSFEETLLPSFLGSGLTGNVDLRKGTGVRMYLDGLDELPSEEKRRALINLLREAVSSHPNLSFFITSRDYVEGDWLAWIPRLFLAELSADQKMELASKWLPKTLLGEFQQQVKNLPSLDGLMNVPLLATLILIVFKQTRHLPKSRVQLYNVFFGLMTGGWDTAKNISRQSDFGPRVKELVLVRLAHDLHSRGWRSFDRQFFGRCAQKILDDNDAKSRVRLLDELLADGLLACSGEDFFFSHHSFQEYLTARGLFGMSNSRGFKRARTLCSKGDDWWEEVVKFYIGLSDNPVDLARELSSERRFFDWLQEMYPQLNLMRWIRSDSAES